MASLVLPILYFAGLGLVYYIFSIWLKLQQKLQQSKFQVDSYFGPNLAKDLYEELSEQWSPETPEGSQLLMTGLLKRACTAVARIWKIRDEKQPLSQLVKQGAVGEDLYERLLKAEQELEIEVNEIMEDAEMYKPGWKQSIFNEATQIVQMQMQHERRNSSSSAGSPASSPGAASEHSATSPTSGSARSSTASLVEDKDDEAKRERLMKELIEEEEKEKAKAEQLEKSRRDSASKKNKGGKKK